MDGASLIYNLNSLLKEDSTSTFLDLRSSYFYCYQGMLEFVRKTKALTSSQDITSVTGQSSYDLNADFMATYFQDSWNRQVVNYKPTGGGDYWIPWQDYDKIIQMNNTASPIPSVFCVADRSLTARITGTATATSALAYEESTLTDAAAPFLNANVGDEVHNTKDGSSGIVIEKTSNSALVTALFGGTNGFWTVGDAYIVIPQALKSLILDPPNSLTGDTITVPYLQKPAPVYSSYRTYRVDSQFEMAPVLFAAFFYKYSDRVPDFGDKMYQHANMLCGRAIAETNRTSNKKFFKVSFNKRAFRDRSYR